MYVYYGNGGRKEVPYEEVYGPKEDTTTDTTNPDTVIPLPELPGWLSWLQSGLDVAGCAPVIGNTADLINTLIYIAVGDYGNASLAAISMIPLVGDAIGKGAKTVKFAVKHSDELVDAIKLVSKNVDKADEITDGVKAAGNGITILGENMMERVIPFANKTGARTLPFGTTPEKWKLLTPQQRWKLNDGALRTRIGEGDSFRYIGIDKLDPRRIMSRESFDLTGSELLRLKSRGIPFETVSPSEVIQTIGRQ